MYKDVPSFGADCEEFFTFSQAHRNIGTSVDVFYEYTMRAIRNISIVIMRSWQYETIMIILAELVKPIWKYV